MTEDERDELSQALAELRAALYQVDWILFMNRIHSLQPNRG